MKNLNLFLAVGLAASTEAARLPLCSAVCLTDAIVATGCNAISTDCICRSEVFVPTVTECVEKRCPEDDKLATLESVEQFCSATSMHNQLKKRGDDTSSGWDAAKSSTTTPAHTTTKPATSTTTPAKTSTTTKPYGSTTSFAEWEAVTTTTSSATKTADPTTSATPAPTSTEGWPGLKGWWGSGFFGFGRGHGRGRGRPHWGWARPTSTAAVTVTVTGTKPTSTPKPVDWVPSFSSGSNDWWKQQSAEWWAENGYDWWRANGWHFAGPQWYWGKSEQWWQAHGHQWWRGPSHRGNGNWRGGRPWWPSAPAPTQAEPAKPTATPTYTPPDDQAWEDWPGWPSSWPSDNQPSGPTPTPDPGNDNWHPWQGWNPSEPSSTPTSPESTHTHPTWVPYTTTKPVQTVIPTGSGW